MTPTARRAIGLLSAGLLAVPLTALSGGAAFAATTGPHRTAITGDRPAFAVGGNLRGSVPDAAAQAFTVDLARRDAAGERRLLHDLTTPGSASYGHYLTPAQYRDRFGATQAAVDQVTSFLQAQGLSVTDVSPTRTTLHVTGTARQVFTTFGAALKTWNAGRATPLQAPDRALTLPSTVAGYVAGVRGLAQTTRLTTPASGGSDRDAGSATAAPATGTGTVGRKAPPGAGFVNAGPCSAYNGEKVATGTPAVDGIVRNYAVCGYTPQQLRSAYGVDKAINSRSPIDGRGTRVAIVDAYASPTIAADAAQYSANRGLPGFTSGQFTQVPPVTAFRYGYGQYGPPPYDKDLDICGEQGWYGEETLDVQAVHGIAPGAKVVYAPSASCFDNDFIDAINNVVDKGLADEISNSWGSQGEGGLDPALLQAYQSAFSQAAIQGIGVYFSSGDSGDETDNLGTPSPDFPASDPLVTAVGGTSIGIDKNGARQWETGWGTGRSVLTSGAWSPAPPGTHTSGGGGGTSSLFDQPDYQAGVVPDSLATASGTGRRNRVVPDVAIVGDPNTGFLVGQTQTFLDSKGKTYVAYGEYRIGGTSLSSPLMAGLVAIADQADGFHHGFVNPSLYPLVGSPYVVDEAEAGVHHYVVRNDYKRDPTTGISNTFGPTVTSLRSINLTQTITVAKGYDNVTGVGSPNGFAFLTHLGSAVGPPTR